ncbi:putative uncharacterized protein [Firmicutes bacterium CAG:534]|nr:putative uncharacterized protein [Firmicutes bacterium CAG:534]
MKKRTGVKNAVWALALVTLLLGGCGSKADRSSATAADMEMAEEAAYDADGAYLSDDIYSVDSAEVTDDVAENGAATPQVEDTSRKLIKNVNLSVETETFEELLATITEKTESFSGYIEESYTYNGSNYYGRGTRNASMTVRIPAQQLDAFLSSVSEVSNVISRNDSVSDVTLQYVDMESHKKALTAEQDRLLELLEQAESVEDIITIESRLSDVRYQIESMESQLRTLQNQVSYSTVYLDIQEVEKLTPVEEQTRGEMIREGFVDSLYGVGNGLLDFGTAVIIDLPYLVVWAAVILLVILIIRLLRKHRKNKEQKKMQEKQEKDIKETAAEAVNKTDMP